MQGHVRVISEVRYGQICEQCVITSEQRRLRLGCAFAESDHDILCRYILHFQLIVDLRYSRMSTPSENVPSSHVRTEKAQIRLRDAQSDQGLHCSLIKSLDTTKCLNGEQMTG